MPSITAVAQQAGGETAWPHQGPAHGLWSTLGDVRTAEMAARAGYDFVALDMQHGVLTDGQMLAFVRGAESCGLPVLVRTRGGDPDMLAWVLDVGADGVIVPMIEDRSSAEALVRATRYPPEGARSFGPARAFERGTSAGDAFRRRPLVVGMIETVTGVENVQEIASVSGLDGLFVGPGDLALSLGRQPSLDLPDRELNRLIKAVGHAALANGMTCGVYCGGAPMVRRYQRAGFQLLVVTSDLVAFSSGVANALAAVRRRSDRSSSR
jgi:4-hydroxy-2-oxoheptanedioate aldolase